MLFGGYIRLKADGNNISYFICKCKKSGYPLYNIKKTKDGVFFDVKSKDYNKVIDLCNRTDISIETCKKFGIIMKLFIYKSRKAFFAVILALSLYYGVNSCFISEISISGNEVFTDTQIMKCLEENGVYVGRTKFGINPNIFQNEVIKDFPGLSWIWLKIDGTKAIIDVREKVSKPEFFDYKAYGNMIAGKDGVIKSAIASGGTLVVSEGMYVRKGDILISGVYDFTENAPVRFVNADGIVDAVTSYSIEDNFDCDFIKYKVSGEPKISFVPAIFDIKLWDSGIRGSTCLITEENNIKYRIFGKNYLPLAFTKTKYCEIIRKEYALSQNEAKQFAVNELIARLKLSMPDDARIKDTKNNITVNPDGTFKVSVSIECVENIAIKQPIEVEE